MFESSQAVSHLFALWFNFPCFKILAAGPGQPQLAPHNHKGDPGLQLALWWNIAESNFSGLLVDILAYFYMFQQTARTQLELSIKFQVIRWLGYS